MDRNNHTPETQEVNPAIAAVTTPEEIAVLHNFLKEQNPEADEKVSAAILGLIDKAANVFGEDLVKESLNYLATSRRGLHIEDLNALLGDTWNNQEFAKVAVCFGFPIVVAFENVLVIPSAQLRKVLTDALSEADQTSFHSDIAFRLLAQPEMEPLRVTETMYHLLRSNKLQTAANFLATATGPTLNASAGAVGSTFVENEAGREDVLSLLDQTTDNRFELYRHFINETFIAMVQHTSPENVEALITGVEQKLLAVMGEENTIDNILLIALTGLRVASVHLQKQEMDKVKEYFDRSIGILDRLIQLNPGADAFSWFNSDALFNLGMICMDMRQPKAAQHCFDVAFDIAEQKVATEPEDSPNKLMLASWFVTVCRVCQQIQDKEAGKKYFTRGKNILKEAITAKSNMAAQHAAQMLLERDLMVMYNDFGDLCHENGLSEEAGAAYANALVIGERLAEQNPQVMELMVAPSITLDRLGKMYAELKDLKNAETNFLKSLSLRQDLSAKSPEDIRLKHDLAAAYHNMASLYLQFGENAKIESYLIDQQKVLKSIFEAAPRQEGNIFPWMDSVISLGDYYYSNENYDAALESLTGALEGLKQFLGAQVTEGLLARIATLHYKTGLVQIKKELYTPAHANINAAVELWKQLFEATKNPGYEKNKEKAEEVLAGFTAAEENNEEK